MSVSINRARFDDKWIPEPNSGCWLWTAGTYANGNYGGFYDGERKKQGMAHRAAWELYRDPIPQGLNVLHKCDTTICVNPDHLFLGTQLENIADRDRKGRQWDRRGERNGSAKLTAEKVKEIRSLHTAGENYRTLAERFGIHFSTIGRIVRKEKWKQVLLILIAALSLTSCSATVARQEVRQTQASWTQSGQDSGILSDSTGAKGFAVNQDWINGYDSLLKTYGKTLSPPRKKGDRQGIEKEGDHYRIQDSVMEKFLVLNQRRVDNQVQ